MYAVIQTGGKQYRVSPGDTIQVEKLDVEAGAELEIDQVLLVVSDEDVAVGRPIVEGAKVTAEVVSQGRARKIVIFKYKRRKKYRRKMGHRQAYTALKITRIHAPVAAGAEAAPAGA